MVWAGDISAAELIEKTLQNCEVLNEGLNIFTAIAGIDALEQAKAVDRRVKNGEKPVLAGVPVAVKDDICYGVLPTTIGSTPFQDFISPITATAVERVMDAGAVVIGKTNLDNMGQGSTTLSSPFGPAVNPWIPERAAGSAGAAAVATGACMIALESDSGGALRQGASHCGVTGLRPTLGRISRYGLTAYSPSFATVGITALNSGNVLPVLDVLTGFDERDVSTAVFPDKNEKDGGFKGIENFTVGYPAGVFKMLAPEYFDLFRGIKQDYIAAGINLEEIDLGLLQEGLRAYHVIASAESSSTHARFDGIRFGKAADAENLDQMYLETRRNMLGPDARRCSVFGAYLLSKGNYDLYYRQALKVKTMIIRDMTETLNACDCFLLPVVNTQPPVIAGKRDFIDQLNDDLFCAPASLAGLPSLCLPFGRTGQLPVGLQVVGRPFDEKTLLGLSLALPSGGCPDIFQG